jgi:hypothetical protein
MLPEQFAKENFTEPVDKSTLCRSTTVNKKEKKSNGVLP